MSCGSMPFPLSKATGMIREMWQAPHALSAYMLIRYED